MNSYIIDVLRILLLKDILFSGTVVTGSLAELKEHHRYAASLSGSPKPGLQIRGNTCHADPPCTPSTLCAAIKYLWSTYCVLGKIVLGL